MGEAYALSRATVHRIITNYMELQELLEINGYQAFVNEDTIGIFLDALERLRSQRDESGP